MLDARREGPAKQGSVLAALPIALILGYTLVFYREIGVEGRTVLSFDPVGYFYPHLTYLAESLRAGRLPLWDPYLFGGVPFLANSQTGVFYLPNWIVLVLDAPRAYSWLIVGHAALAAVGGFLFSRRALGTGRLGALAVALVFGFGGWPSAQSGHLNQFEAMSWLPYLLLAADSVLRQPARRPAVLGGAVLALQFLAGHSQSVFLSAWTLVLYAGWKTLGRAYDAWRSGERLGGTLRWLTSRLVAFGLLGLVALGLSAPQLLPTLDLSGRSIRAAGLDYGYATSFSFPPYRILEGLLPSFGDSPLSIVGDPPFTVEWLGYVGLTGLLLAGLAVVLRRDRHVLGFLLIALVALGLAFGGYTPLYKVAFRHLPGFSLFRVPARWLLAYTFSLACLAGLGLDAVAGEDPTRPRREAEDVALHPFRKALGELPVLVRLVGMLLAIVVLLALFSLLHPWRVPLVVPDPATLALWAVIVVLGLVLIALARSRQSNPIWGRLVGGRPLHRVVITSVLLATLSVELSVASLGLDLNDTGYSEVATAAVPETAFLQARASEAPDEPFRVLGVSQADYSLPPSPTAGLVTQGGLSPGEIHDSVVALEVNEVQRPNLPLEFGISTIDGYDGGVLPLRRYNDLKSLFPKEIASDAFTPLWVQLRTSPPAKLLGWLNVRYLLLDPTAPEPQQSDYRLVFSGNMRIYENQALLPRAFVVGRVDQVSSAQAALARLGDPGFDPRAEAVVEAKDWAETGGGPSELGGATSARISEYQPERVVVEADLGSPGLLVLTDTNYPGWRATVDGVEQPVVTANFLFRGVRLPAGRHQVVFSYSEQRLTLGLAVFGVAVLVALGLLAWRSRPKPGDGSHPLGTAHRADAQ